MTTRFGIFALGAFCAAGISFTSLGDTSADAFEKPGGAAALTDKSGTITSTSGSFNSGPASAFANDGSSRMLKQSKALNLMYTFASPTVVNGYGIKAGGSYFEAARGPKSWKIFGSNDYDPSAKNDAVATWVELDSRGQGDRCAETGWTNNEYRYYAFDNSAAYTTYKIDITANNGNNYTQWQYMEYCYVPNDVRSLTVESSTRAVGPVDPGYGSTSRLIGSEAVCSAFDSEWTSDDGKERAACVGYVAYKDDGTGRWSEWTRGDGASFVIDEFPDVNVKLVWDIAYSAKVSVEGFAHGAVSGDGWHAYGSTVELTAAADEGYEFSGWKNAETGERIKDNPMRFTLTAPVTFMPKFVRAGAALERYVSTDGSDDNDGQTAGTPFATIAAAIEDLGEGTVYVAPGTYEASPPEGSVNVFVLDKPVGIVGTGDSPADVVIRRKSGDCRVIELNHAGAFVRNATISGGYSNANKGAARGGNVHIGANGGTLEDCIISDGTVRTYNSAGGNIWAEAGRIVRCEIRGGNCTSGNGALGGGALLAEGTAVVENCLITGNKVGYSSNGPTASAGVRARGSASVVNCTIIGNGDANAAYGGCYADGDARIVNCAIFGNLARPDETHPGNASFGGTADCYANCACETAPNETCIECDVNGAGFAEYSAADYSLSVASPLRDAGMDYELTGAASATDFAGGARIFNDRVDIGAYEFEMNGIGGDFVIVGESVGFMPFTARFKATVDGTEGDVTYRWDFDGDGEIDRVTTEAETEWTYSDFDTAGDYTVRLNISADGQELDVEHAGMVSALPRVLYVVPENPDARYPYATRGTAATNVNDAVAAAVLDGITICVADGEYVQTQAIGLSRGISLVGESGNAGSVVIRNLTGYSGDTAACNLLMDNSGAFVSGITFAGAKIRNKPNTGAVTVHDGTVSNCVIAAAEGQVSYYTQCAGLYMDGGLVTHCVIRDNGIDKKSTQGGETAGAMVAGGSLENSLVTGNSRGNTADGVCRAVCVSGAGRVINCDILRNTFGCAAAGGARAVDVGGSATLQNCVVFGNTAKDGETAGLAASDSANVIACLGDGDIDESAFKKYELGDYTPKAGGALSGRGVNPEGWEDIVDLAGAPRIIGRNIDVGCYEGSTAGFSISFK